MKEICKTHEYDWVCLGCGKVIHANDDGCIERVKRIETSYCEACGGTPVLPNMVCYDKDGKCVR